jgi:phosphate transport system permease protein
VARATGEVAPLLLVGVAKYAPGLPVSAEFPYLHLDRQFMHLGFYIYDAGFQSPNVDTAVPLVFATALLLVASVLLINLAAVLLRGRLREAFKAEDLV